MTEFEKNRKIQIKTILFTLKLLVIIFSAIPLFQHFFTNVDVDLKNLNYEDSLIGIVFTLIIVTTVMFFWILLEKTKTKNKVYIVSELIIFYIFCSLAIYFSGFASSPYKFIFLYIIVSHTIEHGMKTGLTVASISSSIIIVMDIIYSFLHPNTNYFENDLSLISMFIAVAWTLGYYVRMESSHIDYLKENANTDGLTGVYNHRYFYECIQKSFTTYLEENLSLTLMMIDIDHFKNYNDIYGHQKGDLVLLEFVEIVRATLRPEDDIFRYGGDEFCVIMYNTNKKQASKIANSLRMAVEKKFSSDGENDFKKGLTVSVGISQMDAHMQSYLDLVYSADSALYKAKFLNRNRVEVYSSILDEISDDSNKNILSTMRSLKALISVINSRDDYTFQHTERVVRYCSIMADFLNLDPEEKKDLVYGAYLHDLGKINLSKELLISDQSLTDEDWKELKRHPGYGATIVSQLGGFDSIVPIIEQHHERFDGKGYPHGLKGNQINYLARILIIADSFDAITNNRPYQKKRTREEAFEELKKCSGTQFDPQLVKAFIQAIKDV